MEVKWWVSCTKFTGQVNTIDDKITLTPPVWRKFIGNRFYVLIEGYK